MRLRELKQADILDFLRGLEVSALSKHNYYRSFHAFFTACQNEVPPKIKENPVAGMARRLPKVRRRSAVGFLSVKETKDFLKAAVEVAPESVGMFALMIFTGVRIEEFRRIPGNVVRPQERIVDIPEEFSKTGQPRLIEGPPDALWEWLKRYPIDPEASIVPAKHVYRRTIAGLSTPYGRRRSWIPQSGSGRRMRFGTGSRVIFMRRPAEMWGW